jgi:hypothetical protein
MTQQYMLERHTHGWLLCARPGEGGVPMSTLNEIKGLFTSDEVIDAGIAHHYNTMGYRLHVVMAICTADGSKLWCKEIEDELADYPPALRWWSSTDVGRSSAAIFHVFCPEHLKLVSRTFSQGDTPKDAADFHRCKRLLQQFPDWRNRLNEVAAFYPKTAWLEIVDRWSELEQASDEDIYRILKECHHEHEKTTFTESPCS